MSSFHIKKGFTLIELLVVISIIGLLASIVVTSLNSAKQKARTAKIQSELNSLLKAVQTYYLNTNSMPVNANPGSWCVPGTVYSGTTCLGELVTVGFFTTLPVNPDSGRWYYYYDYGTFGLVAARLIPPVYGPGRRGWHCSDATGGAGDNIYCLEFDK